uniref:Uncharacterized protein n=1 Tax=Glycine max TaxID=3847 RepID=A0A0R0JGF1_SOYBN
MSRCVSCGSGSALIHNKNLLISPIHNALKVRGNNRSCGLRVQVSMVDSSSADFTRRIERAWSISKKIGYQGVYNNSFAPGQPAELDLLCVKQPRPIVCSSCDSKGHIECKWCAGTGFFILGDNMLCEVPSRNTTCIICTGKGSMCCSDCQGTGFRAKWLGEPPSS